MKHTVRFLLVFIAPLFLTGILNAQSKEALLEKAYKISRFVQLEEDQLVLDATDPATSVYVPLLKEVTGAPETASVADMLDSLNGNPFLGRSQNGSLIWITLDAQDAVLGTFTSREGAAPVHNNASAFNVNTVADGIAKFLITRVKEELSATFFKQFKADIQKDTLLSTIFPATTDVLLQIDDEIYQFNQYLETLRQNFEKDMKTLPVNFRSYIMAGDRIKSPKYQILLEDALLFTQDLINNVPADSIIRYFAYNASVQQKDRVDELPAADRDQLINLGAGLKTLNLFAESLYSTDPDQDGWLSPAEVSKYLNDKHTRTLYLALLWQRSNDITFSDGKTLQQFIGQIAVADDKATRLFRLVKSFAQNCRDTEDAIADYPKNSAQSAYEPFYRYISAVLNLAEIGLEINCQIAEIKHQPVDTQFIQGIKYLNELNYDIRMKRYSAAVGDLLYVIKYLLPEVANNADQYGKILKYSQFIATVAEAENSQQVADAIDAVALPPGSSKIKKQNHFSAAINAYTGGAFGGEKLEGSGESAFVALSAPVGVTCSWQLSKTKRSPGSFSLFVPVIDVGSLVSFRLKDPTASDLPTLEWSNILAPGLYGVYGFPKNIPLSLGVGLQRGPNIRKITTTGLEPRTASAWRYGVFLAVDIPVFNLYFQPGKKPGKKHGHKPGAHSGKDKPHK